MNESTFEKMKSERFFETNRINYSLDKWEPLPNGLIFDRSLKPGDTYTTYLGGDIYIAKGVYPRDTKPGRKFEIIAECVAQAPTGGFKLPDGYIAKKLGRDFTFESCGELVGIVQFENERVIEIREWIEKGEALLDQIDSPKDLSDKLKEIKAREAILPCPKCGA